jgi:isoleucyl-tRNA synthetase
LSPPCKAEGVDAWEAARAQEYLGSGYKAEDYEQVFDILDVWFDSGCTHVFTLESGKWPELSWPADLYLEGSDQHRGWFQSSLLQSCGTRGRAPYNAVLTHGFTMDQKGLKMSKSVGNTVDPLKVMETNGADIIRLWALSVDFTEDHRIGDEILKGVADQYRKLRNTFRYLLGALEGFRCDKKVDVADMPELERYVLHLLADMDAKLKRRSMISTSTLHRLLADFANETFRPSSSIFARTPLLRRAGEPEAAGVPHGARHIVTRNGPLCRAGAGVHGGGSVGHAIPGCGFGAFAGMARG